MESRLGPAAATDLCWCAPPGSGPGSPETRGWRARGVRAGCAPPCAGPRSGGRLQLFSEPSGRHPDALPLGPRPGGGPRAGGLWPHASSSPESPAERWLFLFTREEKEGEGTLSETPQIPRAVLFVPSGIFFSNPDHLSSPFSERKLLRFREKKSRLKKEVHAIPKWSQTCFSYLED